MCFLANASSFSMCVMCIWCTERKYLIDGRAYLVYIFNLNSPLSVLLSMFVNLFSSFENISANIALGELFPDMTEPRNFSGLSITESIVKSFPSSSFSVKS